MMKARVLVLGAGFGGLELAATLSDALGEQAGVVMIDHSDAFVFGFAKLDVLFGRASIDTVRKPYRDLVRPGVAFKQETITAIDPANRTVTTTADTYQAEYLVIALGAALDVKDTPGVVLGENEFYSVAGAQRLGQVLPAFTGGSVVVGACGAPYKCPPATSECTLMLHEYLTTRGIRDACSITLVLPMGAPVPPSPAASKVLVSTFAERKIELILNQRVTAVDTARKVVTLDDGRELPCDLFLGVPKNRAPDVVVASGLTEGGWVTVDPRTLATKFTNVYAVGDIANTGTPKAGVFAEGAARAVATNILAQIRGEAPTATNPGIGGCYIEFGADGVGKVDIDFFGGPAPTNVFHAPGPEWREQKIEFGRSRRARWFGR